MQHQLTAKFLQSKSQHPASYQRIINSEIAAMADKELHSQVGGKMNEGEDWISNWQKTPTRPAKVGSRSLHTCVMAHQGRLFHGLRQQGKPHQRCRHKSREKIE
jgi:hypothetical protein